MYPDVDKPLNSFYIPFLSEQSRLHEEQWKQLFITVLNTTTQHPVSHALTNSSFLTAHSFISAVEEEIKVSPSDNKGAKKNR